MKILYSIAAHYFLDFQQSKKLFRCSNHLIAIVRHWKGTEQKQGIIKYVHSSSFHGIKITSIYHFSL